MKHFIRIFIFQLIFFSICFTSVNASSFNKNTFKERREKFIEKMDNGIAIIAGNRAIAFSGDSHYPFRQNGDFYYLTGFNEPDAVLLLIKGKENKSILFIKELSVYAQIYHGAEHTPEKLKDYYGFDEVHYSDNFDDELAKLTTNRNKVYYSFNNDELTQKINSMFESNWGKPEELINSELIARDLRAIKSDEEIELLQKAIDITNKAQLETAKYLKPGINEKEIEALIEYTFRVNGSEQNGFGSIVGSGKNSCVLHYQDNDQTIKDNVTVVIDIGAEYKEYSADVTRTFPSNGKFTKEQKEIYDIVYEAQQQAIEIIKPGIKFPEVNKKTIDVIAEGLHKLGLVKDVTKKWQTQLWYPHGSSHWLGLDAHDAGDYNFKEGGRILEPGMVFTVEPGIYINEKVFEIAEKLPAGFIPKGELEKFKEEVKEAFEKYKNIGIRIEDDILVTGDGYKNLSEEFPRTAEEIENLMSK